MLNCEAKGDGTILISAGAFHTEARREVAPDGTLPIGLIDGEKLLDIPEKLEVGLKPVNTYEVDHAFFKKFGAQLERPAGVVADKVRPDDAACPKS